MSNPNDHVSVSGTAAHLGRVVTVIVPTYNDPRLPLCLEALHELETPVGRSVQIIVVDNASDESPQGLVEGYAGVTFATEPRRGSYAARNTGIQLARGDVIAFTDSDCRPAKDWLVAAVRRLDDDPDVAAVAGRVKTEFDVGGPSSPPAWWAAIHAFPQESYVKSGWGVTANLVVRREVGDALGWFDAAAQSGGDQDFGRRLTASGRTLVYEPDAVVAHPARTTWRELLTKGRRTAKGYGRMEAQRGTRPRDLLVVLHAWGSELVQVVQRGLRHEALPNPSARFQYIVAGIVVRTFWQAERFRSRLHHSRDLARRGVARQ